MFWVLGKAVALAGLALAAWVWVRRGLSRSRRATAEASRAESALPGALGPALSAELLAAANLTGKPRGLAWSGCDWSATEPVLAWDRATGELVALVGADIRFRALPGEGMEDVPAVGDVRGVTAVLVWRRGRWASDGRTVFNLEPAETLRRYRGNLVPACRAANPAR